MKHLDRFGPLAARLALATIFVCSGVSKLADVGGTGAYITYKGLPFGAALAIAAGLFELVAGGMLALGTRARWSALALAGYLIPVTFIFHGAGGLDAAAAAMQRIEVLKNLAIGGGLLAIAVSGPGPFALTREPSNVHSARRSAEPVES